MTGDKAVPDPKQWAKTNASKVRYFGCRVCDLGPELREALNYLWDAGFRRGSLADYITEAGGDPAGITANNWAKHFDGGPEHGRP